MEGVTAVIQARIGSKRLRGKILKKIKGKPNILLLLDRLSKSKLIKEIIVAIPNTKENDKLERLLKPKYKVFRGSEDNVLKRYFFCAKKYSIKNILRITSDCPLIDPRIIDKIGKIYLTGNYDYVSNIENRSFPDGMDIEFFSFKTLKKAYLNSLSNYDKEHVTKYILRSDKFKKFNYSDKINYSNLRITLDRIDDFNLINKIFNNFKNNDFSYKDIINFYKKNEKIFHSNIEHNNKKENDDLGIEQQTWQRAKKYISGGNMLFSKRPDVFLPNSWPSYYKKAKGCIIQSLDKKQYFDFSIMGIGTNILGYANKEVDSAVNKAVQGGNMSTLNCPEEVQLAEKLIKLHPWAHQVRFARSGGEANAISIRIARAYTGKSKIAFCGYHGWHDWYLAANLETNKNLNEHLLPGLKTAGVNKNLKGSIYPFKYNDFNGLKKLIKKNKDIGVIKMEVIRNDQPKNNFLKKVRKLANEKNIVLIFDECTSGFRQTFGGIHKIYKVEPDVMMLGKALGNGYAITAVLGKKEIMESIKKTFISSTFWTERIGSVAALKTLEIMERTKSWEYITSLGKYIKRKWRSLAKKHKLNIKITGIDALCTFTFKSKYHQEYKTFITQEMLKKKILATTTIYVSVSHNKKNLKKYFSILNKLLSVISQCEKGDDIFRYLISETSTTNFSRLN